MEVATLGGGCFWCLEAVFKELRGVRSVRSGYSGGVAAHPTYEQVCTGATGHAEVVQVEFDRAQISYRGLLEVFFAIHDPTTLNRQGGDVGPQYRSVIFYHSDDQRTVARDLIAELEAQKVWADPIVTQIEPFQIFYPAEDYHVDYFSRNPDQPYCRLVVGPKVAKFRKQFRDKLKRGEA